MRCTRCSAVIKPIVAVDIDGTLGDYHGHFERFAAGWLGWPRVGMADYDGTNLYRDWFCEAFSVDLDTFRAIKLAYRMGGQKRTMPVTQGAGMTMAELRDAGAEVWLVTTRPYLKLDGIDPDTREWLSRHSIPYDHLLYGPQKYERLHEQVDSARVAAVLDDDWRVLEEARALGWSAILLRNPYNRGVKWMYSALGLGQARSLLRMEIQKWYHEADRPRELRVADAETEPEPAA